MNPSSRTLFQVIHSAHSQIPRSSHDIKAPHRKHHFQIIKCSSADAVDLASQSYLPIHLPTLQRSRHTQPITPSQSHHIMPNFRVSTRQLGWRLPVWKLLVRSVSQETQAGRPKKSAYKQKNWPRNYPNRLHRHACRIRKRCIRRTHAHNAPPDCRSTYPFQGGLPQSPSRGAGVLPGEGTPSTREGRQSGCQSAFEDRIVRICISTSYHTTHCP